VGVSVLLVAALSRATATDIGDRLLRTFFIFANQPLDYATAISQGWANVTDGSCDPNFGIAVANGDGTNPTAGSSVLLYFTAAGQIAGFGTRLFGQPPQNLIDSGYWRPASDGSGNYDVSIITRDPSLMCSGATGAETLGDRLVISNSQQQIPLDMADAETAGWAQGNCIPKMGIHHAYDLAMPGNNTWNSNTLVPVLPMFNSQTGAISAVLFTAPILQHVEPFGDYEGPFPAFLMCKNWCASSGCQWPGVTVWVTMHFFFTDPSLNTCQGAACVI